jgi:hypothetical protein
MSVTSIAHVGDVPLAYRTSPTTLPGDKRPMGRLTAFCIGVPEHTLDVLAVGASAFADPVGES